MKIASTERTPGRTHQAAGKGYTFNPEEGTQAPMVCEVADPAAQAVFLHPRNRNLFYVAEPVSSTLTRSPDPTLAAASAAAAERHKFLFEVASQNAKHVIDGLDELKADDLKELRDIELAGGNRKTVLLAIEERRGALMGTGIAEEQAKLILGNDEETVLQVLDSITDAALLAAAIGVEKAGGNRAAVLAKLEQKRG